jgi:hypothetical protein
MGPPQMFPGPPMAFGGPPPGYGARESFLSANFMTFEQILQPDRRFLLVDPDFLRLV